MGNSLLIVNIKGLGGILEAGIEKKSGAEMADFKVMENAWLLLKDGLISSFGGMNEVPAEAGAEQIDATDRFVIPSFVDSHTHLVFARSREDEFVMRIKGISYEEIAATGGGILNSALRLQEMSEDELYEQALPRLKQAIMSGTGALEIKSGYGLTLKDELKMLRVIRRLKKAYPITIRATFLGAHAIPVEYKQNRNGYIDLIINEMLPQIVEEKLADYFDVFCDQGFFTVEETDRLLNAAANAGLRAKIHANELAVSGGVQVAVKHNALSVDHLECTGQQEIDCLKNSHTMPVALPNCSFFLGIPYAPVRKMIDAGLAVCLASDFNPGTSPNSRMSFVVSLGCIQMKLTPEEALNATTINGAAALELSSTHGSITIGKVANLIMTKPMRSLAYLPYAFGHDQIEKVVLAGKVQA